MNRFHPEETGPALFDLLDRHATPVLQEHPDLYFWVAGGAKIGCDMQTDTWSIDGRPCSEQVVEAWCLASFGVRRIDPALGLGYEPNA